MAGIGFELRKLFKEEGIVRTVKAFGYSSAMTAGPMLLCIALVLALKKMMELSGGARLDSELFIATMTYSFIFSIILTSGITMVLTRFVADKIYEGEYGKIITSFHGALLLVLPIAAAIAFVFVSGVSESAVYKLVAYLLFMELVVIWLQTVYMSALKDYVRIFRSFLVGFAVAVPIGWLLFTYTDVERTVIAIGACVVGLGIVAALLMIHLEQVFPRGAGEYFAFLTYFKKHPGIFFTGVFVYSGVFVQNFVYWLRTDAMVVADIYRLMPFYDLPVFYAYLSVVPSLIVFVVLVETSFYEKYKIYYTNVVTGGTYERLKRAKESMQNSLIAGVSLLIEVQLLFSLLSIALGLIWLPKIGFSMEQLDLFVVLVLGFFFFILLFVMLHALMYFDDKKGVLICSSLFFILNAGLTYGAMKLEIDGAGLFIAAVLVMGVTLLRLLYVIRNIQYYTFCREPFDTLKMLKGKKLLRGSVSLFLVAFAVVALYACSPSEQQMKESTVQADGDAVVVTFKEMDNLKEDKRLYERDVDESVKALYITIWPDEHPDSESVGWYEMNRMTDRHSGADLRITIAEGFEDGEGPQSGMFGYGADLPNAKITLRGNSARYDAQKSYKIKLFDETGLWNDQRVLNLNKHSNDLSRIRNKLSFDLMETVPDLTSLRTQFVHLYVKDLTTGRNTGAYEDYGLYTHVEQPNGKFLKTHWLDPHGYLYKVTFFEFQRYVDEIKSTSSPSYDEAMFESILEIKGRKEHEKLIAMLEDVNDMKKPIEEVMETHFDLDNFLTWTAVNILMDNMDTDANNFYLYSPLNSDKWYILPWDYDGAWEQQRQENSIWPHQAGISNYWGSTLHNRFFRKDEHVQLLVNKVEEMREYINEQTIEEQLGKYTPVVKPFLYRTPDIKYLPKNVEMYDQELQRLIDTPKRSVARFLEDLQKPKPFYMNDVDDDGETTLTFSWDISFDLQGDDLFYTVVVAKDPLFTEILHSEEDLRTNSFQMDRPKSGMYYWKVTVRDSEGNDQTSFDLHTDEEGEHYYGVREFEVD